MASKGCFVSGGAWWKHNARSRSATPKHRGTDAFQEPSTPIDALCPNTHERSRTEILSEVFLRLVEAYSLDVDAIIAGKLTAEEISKAVIAHCAKTVAKPAPLIPPPPCDAHLPLLPQRTRPYLCLL